MEANVNLATEKAVVVYDPHEIDYEARADEYAEVSISLSYIVTLEFCL